MIIILLVAVILIGVILFVLLTQFNKPTGAVEPSIDEIVEATVEIPEMRQILQIKSCALVIENSNDK